MLKLRYGLYEGGKKPAIGCAVVLGGKTAVNELMVL